MALAVSCGSGGDVSADRPIVGFILVGEGDDLGYNQAVREGSEELARLDPDLDIRLVENVPETDAAVEAMERLIDEGARVVFATSFGHRAAAEQVAADHPDVVVVHQGGAESELDLPNFGTYWGAHHELLYAAGIAAADATTSGTIGFVVAFPIPTTYVNVDAVTLGAQTVDPDIRVVVSYTQDWCDPAAQEVAYDALIEAGADVLALHQDCTRTLLERAEADGVGIVGYHADGSEVAPRNWLVGAVWEWGELFHGIVTAAMDGEFADSEYNGNYRGSLAGGDNPAVMTEPGPRVAPTTAAAMEAVLDRFRRGEARPFDGPLVDTAGQVRVPAGDHLGDVAADALDYFVAGVEVL